MPKLPEKPQIPLTLPQVRCLRALSGGGLLSLGRIAERAGGAGSVSGDVLKSLAAVGLAQRAELDLDGKAEVAWRITQAGRDALAAGGEAGRELPAAQKDRQLDADIRVSALVPIFGGNRLLAPKVGELLDGCEWVGVPFVGGLSELPHVKARTVCCSDAHAHVVNLARVAANDDLGPLLRQRLEQVLFHELVLAQAQQRCWAREAANGCDPVISDEPDLDWAADYFVCAWMARSGCAGTKNEFQAPLSVRWNAGGGDSVRRFRSATASLDGWLSILSDRVTFVCLDAFAFLAKCKDQARHGVYCDPPFIEEGGPYKHKFGTEQHGRLAEALAGYAAARVVVRGYDCPALRSLYPRAAGWEWVDMVGKKNTNERSPEVLLVRN